MTFPLRLPLPIYNSIPVQYVAPWGDDSNDGQDGFRYPKKTLLAAWDFAFAKYGACEFHVADGTHVGGANQWSPVGTVSVPGQGLWIDGTRNVTPSAPLYPGWRVNMPHRIVGYPGFNSDEPQFEFPTARILPGNVGDVTKPGVRFDVGLWLTNNLGGASAYRNIYFKNFSIGLRLAVNGNPAGNPDADGSRTTAETVAMVHFDQCAWQNDGHGSDTGEGPLIDMGYYLWVYFNQCALNASQDAPLLDERRAAMLVKPGGGGSCLVNVNQCRGVNGGLIYYCGSSTWGLWVDNYLVESDGHALPAVIRLIGPGGRGQGVCTNVTKADDGAGSEPTIVIEGFPSEFQATQLLVGAGVSTRGPCMVFGGSFDASFPVTDFPSSYKMGFAQGKIWGPVDAIKDASPPTAARWRNMVPQRSGGGGFTGPVQNRPIDPTPNAVYTQTGAVGPNGVDSPVRDRFGGFTAFRLATNDTNTAAVNPIEAPMPGVVVGDRFAMGMWIRPATGSTIPVEGSLATLAILGVPNPTLIDVGCHNGTIIPAFRGDGDWQWYSAGQTITNLNGGNPVNIQARIVCYAQPTAVVPDGPHSLEFCGMVFLHIPAGEISDNEFARLIQNMSMMPQTTPGYVGTREGQVLAASGGFATGDYTAIGSHVIGATNGYITLRDMEGNTLGVIEVKTLTS
jgi:hypothetical protein